MKTGADDITEVLRRLGDNQTRWGDELKLSAEGQRSFPQHTNAIATVVR